MNNNLLTCLLTTVHTGAVDAFYTVVAYIVFTALVLIAIYFLSTFLRFFFKALYLCVLGTVKTAERRGLSKDVQFIVRVLAFLTPFTLFASTALAALISELWPAPKVRR